MIRNYKLFFQLLFICFVIFLTGAIMKWSAISNENRKVPGSYEYDYYMMNEFGKEIE